MEHARLVDAMEALVRDLQAAIVAALEAADGARPLRPRRLGARRAAAAA